MVEITIIFGSEAVNEYEETGKIPTDEWLADNGGVVQIKQFESQELLDAYLEGINDADGWLESLVLDPFTVELTKEIRESNI